MMVSGKGQNYVTKETHIVLLWVAVVLLAFASIMGRDMYGLSQLSSMSAKLFSLPSAKPTLVAQSDAAVAASFTEDPRSRSSFLDEHHNASAKNPAKPVPTTRSRSAEFLKNASDIYDFEESFGDNDVTATNGSASSPHSAPATETENSIVHPNVSAPQYSEKPFLVGTNISLNSNISSTSEKKPRIMNNGTEEVGDSPSREAEERSFVTATNSRESSIAPTNGTNEV